jgi:hypothetical protein
VKRLLLLALACCSSGGSAPPHAIDAGRTRRVIEPPPGQVRALPPHAIDAGGVGPYYRLGATQSEVFAVLPSIPRVAILDIEKILDASVIRAEDDTLLVGSRPGERISFIAVLAPGIAKTDGGLAVGAHLDGLTALGPPLVDPRAAHDPRLFTAAAMPGVHFVIDGDRVSAILLQPAPETPVVVPPSQDGGVPEPPRTRCTATLTSSRADILAAAGLKASDARADVYPACVTSDAREAVVTSGDVITLVDADGERAHRISAIELKGLVWAAPLRNDLDRDEIVAITERRTDDELVVELTVLRLDGGRLVRFLDQPVYPARTLTRTSAQWIGARLEDLGLLITVDARPEGFVVGGVLVHAPLTGVRDVAPLLPQTVPRRRRPIAETTQPASPADAAVPARDAGLDAAAAHDAGAR